MQLCSTMLMLALRVSMLVLGVVSEERCTSACCIATAGSDCGLRPSNVHLAISPSASIMNAGSVMLQVSDDIRRTRVSTNASVASKWSRFDGRDCVKQVRANDAQCIPCKKTLDDGTQVDRFHGNCKRDATVLASQIFTPWNFCLDNGSCAGGRLPKFSGQKCWVFNKGEFLPWDGPAGVCIKESWHSRHIPTVTYALANMAHGWKNVADFTAAYQWSMEQRASWGDRPATVMTCDLFCKGEMACGVVGDCTCGHQCSSAQPTSAPTSTASTLQPTSGPTALSSPAPSAAPTVEDSTTWRQADATKCLEKGQFDDDCCALTSEAACADDYEMEIGSACHTWRRTTYFRVHCYPPSPETATPSYSPTLAPTPTTPVPTDVATEFAVLGTGACRGTALSHNPRDWYVRVKNFAGTLQACQSLCLGQATCMAIEFKVGATNHCELWQRLPQATNGNAKWTCMRKSRATPTPTRGTLDISGFTTFGMGACRGRQAEYVRVSGFSGSIEDCVALCHADGNCAAVEFRVGGTDHCELWKDHPQFTSGNEQWTCLKKR